MPADRLSAPVAEAVRARVLQNARREHQTAPVSGSIRAQQVINEVYDDLVKMQNGWQLTHLPTRSPRAGVRGRAISSGREFVQRSLHPLPAQSERVQPGGQPHRHAPAPRHRAPGRGDRAARSAGRRAVGSALRLLMRVVVASTFVPFVEGGGRMIVDDLVRALRERGHEVDTIELPFDSQPREQLEQMLGLRLLDVGDDVGDGLIAIRTPSYLLRHPTTRWSGSSTTTAAPTTSGERPTRTCPHTPRGWRCASAIIAADQLGLGEARRCSRTRCRAPTACAGSTGSSAEVLYPPLDGYRPLPLRRPPRTSSSTPRRITRAQAPVARRIEAMAHVRSRRPPRHRRRARRSARAARGCERHDRRSRRRRPRRADRPLDQRGGEAGPARPLPARRLHPLRRGLLRLPHARGLPLGQAGDHAARTRAGRSRSSRTA